MQGNRVDPEDRTLAVVVLLSLSHRGSEVLEDGTPVGSLVSAGQVDGRNDAAGTEARVAQEYAIDAQEAPVLLLMSCSSTQDYVGSEVALLKLNARRDAVHLSKRGLTWTGLLSCYQMPCFASYTDPLAASMCAGRRRKPERRCIRRTLRPRKHAPPSYLLSGCFSRSMLPLQNSFREGKRGMRQ